MIQIYINRALRTKLQFFSYRYTNEYEMKETDF